MLNVKVKKTLTSEHTAEQECDYVKKKDQLASCQREIHSC